MKLDNEIAWITGAARGIGFATAKLLAKEGARIIINDIQPLDGAVSNLKEIGPEIFPIRGDVTNAQEVKNMIDIIMRKFTKINILVNCAGGALKGPFSIIEMDENDWDRVVNLNLKGTFLCCKAVIPYMRQQKKGKIVNIASLAGRSTTERGPDYASAKAGVLGLTRQLAKTEGPFGIRVNAVSPGTILTEMMAERFYKQPKEEQEKRIARTPLGRFGRPEEVANAILFLVSEDSSFVTGANIDVNGGRFMAM